MNRENKEKLYINLVVLSVFPVFLTIIVGIIVDFLIGDLRYGYFSALLTVWISMIVGMVAFPIFYLRKYDNTVCNFVDLGLVMTLPFDGIFIVVLILAIIFVKAMFFGGDIIFAFIQNIPIAFCEEFWCKGVIFTQLKHIFRSNYTVIILSAMIFAFITHMGNSFVDNLILRFPFGLLTGFIYYKTGKLIYPVSLHLFYNSMIA
ncbi:CPBP family intramembrane glutamic endopeptidase [Veillonella denticariosi]|uniref:CPBP family intramembrane glutamic endopeptidase n=1 Tax=Veillonella denticariosi TaxID=419208 RepID=UPI0024915A5F|nr:type II CAAX endopeptidase family protein [Veillonella denticariosi]